MKPSAIDIRIGVWIVQAKHQHLRSFTCPSLLLIFFFAAVMVGVRGDDIAHGKQGESQVSQIVCQTIFDRKNVRWAGPSETGDKFAVPIPSHFGQVEWKTVARGGAVSIDSAVLDFTNAGHAVMVFRVHYQTSTTMGTSYIVADDEERDKLIAMLEAIPGKPDWDTKLTQLVQALSRSCWKPENCRTSSSVRFRSKMFNPSDTETYKGWYTSSEVFTYQKTTFILAVSINNIGGPTAAVFKPDTTGALKPICHFSGGHSDKKFVRTVFSERYACPSTESNFPKISDEVPIQWETIGRSIQTTVVNFPGWEGPRRLFKQSLIAGHYQYEYMFVGPPGKDYLEAIRSNISVGARPFEAIDDIDFLFDLKWHDSVGLVKTKSGIYIVTWNVIEERGEDSPPLGTTFHIVEQGNLVPVCMFKKIARYDGEEK